jgi:hypothetical protein
MNIFLRVTSRYIKFETLFSFVFPWKSPTSKGYGDPETIRLLAMTSGNQGEMTNLSGFF